MPHTLHPLTYGLQFMLLELPIYNMLSRSAKFNRPLFSLAILLMLVLAFKYHISLRSIISFLTALFPHSDTFSSANRSRQNEIWNKTHCMTLLHSAQLLLKRLCCQNGSYPRF